MSHSIIVTTVPWESLTRELDHIPIEIKLHLHSIIKVLHTSDEKLTLEKWISSAIERVEACLDRIWEALNSGYWKEVPVEYRYCYSLCAIVKAVLLELEYKINAEGGLIDEGKKKTVVKNIINQIDKGILLGAPLPSVPNLLTTIARNLNNYYAANFGTMNLEEISINYEEINSLVSNYPDRYFEKPSMETFYNKIFSPKSPAILTGCMNYWKALTLWRNSDYLNKIAGSRTVPIEIGSRYTDTDWTQRFVNFSEFLQKYIIANNSEVAYLAQHQLFEQIPELKEDFEIPEYCLFSDEENDESLSEVDINVWFGPAHTVSPLHFDPKNNLLSQVFGYKRVILYSPAETENLYPYDSKLLNNTAQVDPVKPDYNKWPNFRKANGMTFYLKPGEMLYIPPKWWHHVTAFTPSFSISFWWD
ncbi:bifunctional peptidase and arginyl-hydroxylase JMJD5 [Linepithema humile]|uniref:bifunctional peptidase and arginyl-hydroxylase JMJD5 n=1 Tax=Linepithema humile TaxID=83485 RepID=UPI00351F640D